MITPEKLFYCVYGAEKEDIHYVDDQTYRVFDEYNRTWLTLTRLRDLEEQLADHTFVVAGTYGTDERFIDAYTQQGDELYYVSLYIDLESNKANFIDQRIRKDEGGYVFMPDGIPVRWMKPTMAHYMKTHPQYRLYFVTQGIEWEGDWGK